MRKTRVKLFTVILAVLLIPVSVFAGIVCDEHLFKYKSESVTGYNKDYSSKQHFVKTMMIYECSVPGCHKKDRRPSGYAEDHSFGAKYTEIGYDDLGGNHIKYTYDAQKCKCGRKKLKQKNKETQGHSYTESIQVGYNEGKPVYKKFCKCGHQKPEY